MPNRCPSHGEQGYWAFACRDIVLAVASGGPSLDVTWYECVLDGNPVWASLLCSGCIGTHHLPASPASLDGPRVSELSNDAVNYLATPICIKCFEGWRKAAGVAVTGNFPSKPS